MIRYFLLASSILFLNGCMGNSPAGTYYQPTPSYSSYPSYYTPRSTSSMPILMET